MNFWRLLTALRSLLVALAVLVPAVVGAPLERRIAQIISDSTTQWEHACVRGILTFYRSCQSDLFFFRMLQVEEINVTRSL